MFKKKLLKPIEYSMTYICVCTYLFWNSEKKEALFKSLYCDQLELWVYLHFLGWPVSQAGPTVVQAGKLQKDISCAGTTATQFEL